MLEATSQSGDKTGFRPRAHLVAIGLIAALLVFVAVGTAYLLLKSYDDTREAVRAGAASAAQVVAANVQWALETAHQVLRRVDDSLGADISAPPIDAAELLGEAIATLPGAVKVYVVDAGGTTRLTTDPDFKPIDVTDREYFAAVAAGEPWHVSSLLVSRLNGEQIFTLSKRIERNGVFVGAAILSFNSELLHEVWRSLNLDPQSTVSLLRDDGQLVARYPLPAGPIDLKTYVLFTDYLPAAASGTYDAVSPADGVSRIVGYLRVPGTNLVALSSISTGAAFAAVNTSTLSVLAIAVPAALALLLIAYWTFRVLQREAAQRENEEQFRVFAEAMPNHVWSAQPDGLLDWFNSGVYQYSGAKPGTLDGQSWTSIVHPQDLSEAAASWSRALASGQLYETEFRVLRHDGAYRWHLVRAVPIRDQRGTIIRWIGTNTDIDDQKHITEALAESEARLRLAIEAGQLAVWDLDVATAQITHSPALNRLYGFADDATPSLADYQSRYAPGELERVAAFTAERLATGATELEVEVRHLWPDGTEKWLLIRAQAPREATRAIGVVIDITERKRVEQALGESERRFRLSQRAAGIASLELDIPTGMVIGSDRFWEIWGLSQRDSVHISVLEGIVLPEDATVRSTEQTRQAATARPSVEYRIRRPDTGELRWLSRNIEFTYDEAGKPLKMFGIMQDITEQKEAQARQLMLTHELEHRIKNILATVSAIASQTLKDTSIETARDALNERLRALANAHDILTRTRWTEAAMADVVKATVAPFPRDKISVSGPDLPLQPKMALSLALAVNELATNAVKYGALSQEGGRVDVAWTLDRTSDGGDRLTWTWRESGGPPVTNPARKGFGTFLIARVLAADFNGEMRIEYLSTGVEATLSAPAPPQATLV